MSRRQLTALCSTDLDDPARHELERAGAIVGGVAIPMLTPIIEVLASVATRLVLRRWLGVPVKISELFLSPRGMVILPGGPDPDVLQELTWHPRSSAVSRVLGELLNLPPIDAPPLLDAVDRPWRELVGHASEPGSGLRLADLRRSSEPSGSLASVMVLAWHRDGGIVEVLPTTTIGQVTCRPVRPLDVWVALTTLASSDATGRISG